VSDRVLVTGAAGFVGANLVRRLLALGAEVHAVVRPAAPAPRLAGLAAGLVVHAADVRDAAALAATVAAARPTAIAHLAAAHGHPRDPASRAEALAVSVEGTANLLRATETCADARFVHVGSSLEFGPRARPLRPDDPLLPTTLRGVAKAAAALLCAEAARAGRPVVIVRPFSVYGPWEASTRLVPRAILAALRGEELPLTGPGHRRDYVHVDDVVDGILAALRAPGVEGQAFQLGTGEQWANEELAEQVAKVVGRPLRVRPGAWPASPSDTGHWVADATTSRARLGWSPRHDLASGLAHTVAWFRAREGGLG
jgi:nucleoside-diphosphate-sugar epimerase